MQDLRLYKVNPTGVPAFSIHLFFLCATGSMAYLQFGKQEEYAFIGMIIFSLLWTWALYQMRKERIIIKANGIRYESGKKFIEYQWEEFKSLGIYQSFRSHIEIISEKEAKKSSITAAKYIYLSKNPEFLPKMFFKSNEISLELEFREAAWNFIRSKTTLTPKHIGKVLKAIDNKK